MRTRVGGIMALVVVMTVPACSRRPVVEPDAPGPTAPRRIEAAHLPNAYRVHDKVISGGLPEGEAAFHELSDLGVKTIVSVDGARPDVATARRFGMRYVHLPHGYNGIPAGRVLELAKAVRDLDGAIYIHCHHGKHRSPAAAAVACVAAGLIPPEAAESVLRTAGTSDQYLGLYQAAADARRIGDAELDTANVKFREVVDLPPTAEAMVAIEHTFGRLKLVSQSGWKPRADHPDIDPAHEALILREQFAELLRTPETGGRPDRFRQMVGESEEHARRLEAALRAGEPAPGEAAFKRIANLCTACHKEFRDTPLSRTLLSRRAVTSR